MGEPHQHVPYTVPPGLAMVRTWIARLPEKTGRSLEEWIEHIKTQGPATEVSRRDWLKTEHGFGTNNALWLARRCDGKGTEDEDDSSYLVAASEWVETMFAAKKAALRPIYEALLSLGLCLGEDVKVCPCKTIVPLYRKHVFAQLKPTANTRLDLGLALRDLPATSRLIDTGGLLKKDRITHRIALASVDEIDDEVKHWLLMAYNLDA